MDNSHLNPWICPKCNRARVLCICDKFELTPEKKNLKSINMVDELIEIQQKAEKLQSDKERLIALCKDLLKGADLLAREENLIQPFLAIVLRHVDTISEFKLTGDD